jgi:serine phosphatase RsbU (regulator of sigma subunit)
MLVSNEAATTDVEQQSSFAIAESLPIADAVRLDQLVLIESAALRDERYPLLRPSVNEPGYRASASVPLKAGAVAVGAIELLFLEERRFGLSDREFLAALADQGGLALERARLQAAEHSIAVRLQHQLLPLRLPDLAGIRNAGEYRAGTALMEVGGDWYDVVALSQTRVALTLGDVVGKGVTAAGVMGRLRSALRALALSCSDPTEVVAQLERFAETIDGAELATLVCADLDLVSGTLRYLHAGHLPTLLLDGQGGSRFLEDGRRTPLGVPTASPAPHSQVTLEPGTTVLLYSDGLVERRGEPLSDGLRRLEQRARSLAHLPPDELARTLVESMTGDNPPSDDIVVLAVSFDGGPKS